MKKVINTLQNALSERFKKVIDTLVENEIASTQDEIARKIGYSSASLSSVLQGRRKVPYEIAVELPKKYPQINRDWLLDGTGQPFTDGKLALAKSKDKTQEPDQPKSNVIHVPIAAWGGILHGYADPVFIEKLEHGWEPGLVGLHYLWPAKGWSMFKKGDDWSAKPGDTLYTIKMEGFKDLLKGHGYVIVSVDGVNYKLFDRIEGNKTYFTCLNEEEKGMVLTLRDIKGIYLVDDIRRKTIG